MGGRSPTGWFRGRALFGQLLRHASCVTPRYKKKKTEDNSYVFDWTNKHTAGIRLLKTACVTLSTCLHVPRQNSRTEDSHSSEASPLLRKSRILSLLGQSCPSLQRRVWATRSS